MQNLKVMEVHGFRVLTTRQLATMYGTKPEIINNNFTRNKDKYVLEKHYIAVSGEEMRSLRTSHQFDGELKRVSRVYFWTEKGALLHAKSLNTDKAWEVYDYLVDFYFRAKGEPKPKTYREIRETALAEKQQAAPKRNSRVVVDAPENPAIQKSMQEIRKYLTSIDVALIECNKYCCEESYVRVQNMLDTLWLSLGNKILDFRDITPKLVEKVY